jgi:hypothetical protein
VPFSSFPLSRLNPWNHILSEMTDLLCRTDGIETVILQTERIVTSFPELFLSWQNPAANLLKMICLLISHGLQLPELKGIPARFRLARQFFQWYLRKRRNRELWWAATNIVGSLTTLIHELISRHISSREVNGYHPMIIDILKQFWDLEGGEHDYWLRGVFETLYNQLISGKRQRRCD